MRRRLRNRFFGVVVKIGWLKDFNQSVEEMAIRDGGMPIRCTCFFEGLDDIRPLGADFLFRPHANFLLRPHFAVVAPEASFSDVVWCVVLR